MSTPESHIFYIPHADDETLSMGPEILHQVSAGNMVFLVLLTDGAADETLHTLNGVFRCPWHEGFHHPRLERYPACPLSKEAFIEARRGEFLKAMELFGVPRGHVEILDLQDGRLTSEIVDDIVLRWEDDTNVPGVRHHHAMSYIYDNHPDHIATGKALLDVLRDGRITNPHWYVKRSIWDRVDPTDPIENVAADTPEHREILRRVHEEVYGRYEPTAGCYAIGGHTHRVAFQDYMRDFTVRRHAIL